MITLFIDTSSSDVSIAILRDNQVLSSIVKNIPNAHSIYTVQFIEEALKEANYLPKDVQKIIVVNGPGSFTGLRIGVTIAKVYAYLMGIPVIPASALKSRCLSVSHNYCLSIVDAHHDNYYIGLYNNKNDEIIPEHFAKKEEVLKLISQYQPIIVGDVNGSIGEYSYLKQELNISNIVDYYKNAEAVDPHLLIPNYLKLPQALENKND